MIEIKSTAGAVIYTSESATTIAEAVTDVVDMLLAASERENARLK
jgi:hypothetical protein